MVTMHRAKQVTGVLLMSLFVLLAACREAVGLIRAAPTPCETPGPDNVLLPPKTKVWSIAPDQQWVIYTEDLEFPASEYGRHYWLAKLECRTSADPVLFLGPTIQGDFLLGFSADTSAVLFQSWTPLVDDKLWVVPLPNVQDKHVLYENFIRWVDWAPDGRRAVVNTGNQGIVLVGMNGSIEQIIPEDTFNRKGGGVISWSPAGDQVAYIEDASQDEPSRLWAVDIRSGERRQLYSMPDMGAPNPDWSPDGEMIAVWDPTTFGPVALVSQNGDVRDIVRLRGAVESEMWSPDGKQLAVMYSEGSGDDRKHYLGVIAVANGAVAETPLDAKWGIEDWLDGNTIDSWTPDSRKVVLKVSQFKEGNWVDVLVYVPVH